MSAERQHQQRGNRRQLSCLPKLSEWFKPFMRGRRTRSQDQNQQNNQGRRDGNNQNQNNVVNVSLNEIFANEQNQFYNAQNYLPGYGRLQNGIAGQGDVIGQIDNTMNYEMNLQEVRARNKVRIKTSISKRDIKCIETFDPDQGDQYKYCCPVCFRYFNTILVSSCCKNYICRLCIGEMAKKAKREPKFVIRCTHCMNDDYRLCDVQSSDPQRWYSDTPAKWQKDRETKEQVQKIDQCENLIVPESQATPEPDEETSPQLARISQQDQNLNQNLNLRVNHRSQSCQDLQQEIIQQEDQNNLADHDQFQSYQVQALNIQENQDYSEQQLENEPQIVNDIEARQVLIEDQYEMQFEQNDYYSVPFSQIQAQTPGPSTYKRQPITDYRGEDRVSRLSRNPTIHMNSSVQGSVLSSSERRNSYLSNNQRLQPIENQSQILKGDQGRITLPPISSKLGLTFQQQTFKSSNNTPEKNGKAEKIPTISKFNIQLAKPNLLNQRKLIGYIIYLYNRLLNKLELI